MSDLCRFQKKECVLEGGDCIFQPFCKEIRELEKENTRLTELKEWLFREFNRLFTALDKRK